MRIDVGIIGGTGVGEKLAALGGVPVHVPSPDGLLKGRQVEIDGVSILAVSRHSDGHKVPPHLVRYSAMARGLRYLGVKACLSTAAVGSLRGEWGPGTLVVCSDFLDVSGRNLTLFNRQVVHRDFSEPFSLRGRQALIDAGSEAGLTIESKGVYVNANGPRYETAKEIEAYRTLGGDIVGMTAASEAIVMREAEVPYACLAIVTNLAAGMTQAPLDHLDVVDVMNASSEKALDLLVRAVKKLVN